MLDVLSQMFPPERKLDPCSRVTITLRNTEFSAEPVAEMPRLSRVFLRRMRADHRSLGVSRCGAAIAAATGHKATHPNMA